MSELSEKQKRFCEEYLIDLNGTQAAIRAGYSNKTANEQASRMLAKVNIQELIQELKSNVSDKNNGLIQQVIDELKKVGFSNIQDYINPGNEIADLTKIDREKAAAVESITITETEFEGGLKTKKSFKLHSKLSALTDLGRHLGIFEKDNQQQSKVINVTVPEE